MSTIPHRRSPWPIAISATFLVFFAGLVSFIVYASTQRVDLVRPDYYEEEVRHQQQIDRVERTRGLGEKVSIRYEHGRRALVLQLPIEHTSLSSGQIHLYRPSDARLDQKLSLTLDSSGAQQLPATGLRPGLWKVRVQWTLQDQEYYFDQPVIIPAVP